MDRLSLTEARAFISLECPKSSEADVDDMAVALYQMAPRVLEKVDEWDGFSWTRAVASGMCAVSGVVVGRAVDALTRAGILMHDKEASVWRRAEQEQLPI